MIKETQEKKDPLEQVLKEMDKNPSKPIELPDSVLANIVGGTYHKAKVAANFAQDTCGTCACRCI